MSGVSIRPAEPGDTLAISTLLVASITRLCSADHGDDPKIIATWTANKTPQHIASWIAGGTAILLVAEAAMPKLAGVCAAFPDGRIVLNYVHPDAQYRGVSHRMLMALEAELRSRGVEQASLTAARTAFGFYHSRGWKPDGPEQYDYGFPGQPMRKHLGAPVQTS